MAFFRVAPMELQQQNNGIDYECLRKNMLVIEAVGYRVRRQEERSSKQHRFSADRIAAGPALRTEARSHKLQHAEPQELSTPAMYSTAGP
jgi:hypothetical protein